MPADPARQLTLNLNLIPGGVFPGAWRDGGSAAGSGRRFSEIEHYIEVARIAERGKLDAVFLADTPVWRYRGAYRPFRGLEPTVALTAVAAATERIGLVATASTSYNDPYNLARRISTLDHVSGGRAAWNIVATTGDDVARNFNRSTALDHEDRYRRAEEFLQVAFKLWDSWEEDAFPGDRGTGVFVDEGRIHRIGHVGEHFQVDGPLNLPRSPQGRPVLVQAGSSERGIGLASRYADAVYTVQPTLEGAQAFRRKVRERAAGFGRDPELVKVLPGLITVVGDTETAAKARRRELADLHDRTFALNALALQVGVPAEALELDRELPWELVPEDGALGSQQGHFAALVGTARRERLTVREILDRQGGGLTHVTAVGAPEQIADRIEEWFRAGASDGFNVMPAQLPSVAEDFVDGVVPILVRRGLFRSEYPGTTLRETYGLPRPEVQRPTTADDRVLSSLGGGPFA
ncbi:LLM class flavin-dependent oxidoreductase [Pseudonocardia sp. NPDC046786]|uniref:LLM class flavin-dependent oxidoreductase n=1 Tax=Pseudonocardia sp. NPDC046786 TaxID=3155471 RepID=UPI0033C0D29D